ncbi:MAG: hypothetical protein NT091_00820 [Candidatus Falkowbacteria bacterium]|nr:hypothetical protein [Candidatus Falkowbacteria bacterium]
MLNLLIDTSNKDHITLTLKKEETLIDRQTIPAKFKQAEVLLVSINKILKKNKITLNKLTKIKINNIGQSNTSLRIGVVNANALGYAAKIKIEGMNKSSQKIILPVYLTQPNITYEKVKT